MQALRHRVKLRRLVGIVEILQDRLLGLGDIHHRLVDRGTEMQVHFPFRQRLGIDAIDRAIGIAAFVCATRQTGERRLDEQQVARELHQAVFRRRLSGRLRGAKFIGTLFQTRPQIAATDHAERIADALDRCRQTGDPRELATVTAHEQIEPILHIAQVLGQRLTDRRKHLAIRPADLIDGIRRLFIGKAVGDFRRLAHRDHRRIGRTRPGDVVEKVLEQLDRKVEHRDFLTLVDDRFEDPIELAEQGFDREARTTLVFQQHPGQRLAGIQQTPQPGRPGGTVQCVEQVVQLAERLIDILPLDQMQQGPVVVAALMVDQLRQITIPRARTDGIGRNDRVQLGREQRGLRDQGRILRGTDVVQHGQEYQRDIGATGLDLLEVGRQLDDTQHQGLGRRVGTLDLLAGHRERELLHLVGQHGRTIDLHHVQRAVGVVQPFDRLADPLGVAVDEVFERGPSLAQRLVQLAANPA